MNCFEVCEVSKLYEKLDRVRQLFKVIGYLSGSEMDSAKVLEVL